MGVIMPEKVSSILTNDLSDPSIGQFQSGPQNDAFRKCSGYPNGPFRPASRLLTMHDRAEHSAPSCLEQLQGIRQRGEAEILEQGRIGQMMPSGKGRRAGTVADQNSRGLQ